MFPAQWGQNKWCCFCLQHENNMAIDAAFRGTLDNWEESGDGCPDLEELKQSPCVLSVLIPLAPGDPTAILGSWCQAHPALCGWAQEGPESRAPLGCSWKATPEMRGHGLSLWLLTPHPKGAAAPQGKWKWGLGASHSFAKAYSAGTVSESSVALV